MHEEEWPDPPYHEEFGGGQVYPDWLIFFLTVDNVYERHLRGVTTRQATSQQRRSIWNRRDWYEKDIPVKELHDPPDSSEGEESQVSTPVIAELSWSQIHNKEHTNWRRA